MPKPTHIEQTSKDLSPKGSDYRNILILWVIVMGSFILMLIYAPGFLKKLASQDPKSYFSNGYQYLSEKKYDMAIDSFKTAVSLENNNPQYHKYLGLAYQESKDYANAIKVFNELVKLEPANQEYWDLLSWSYYFINDFPNALAGWNKILELNPKNALGYAGVARVQTNQQQWKDAIQNYEKAIAIDTTQWLFYHALGRAYEATGNLEKSAVAFTHVIQINPNHDDSYYRIGLYEVSRKNWNAAIMNFTKANSIDSRNPFYMKDLATAYYNRKQGDDWVKARALLESILKTNPNDLDAKNRLQLLK